jgi:hypothetical protein
MIFAGVLISLPYIFPWLAVRKVNCTTQRTSANCQRESGENSEEICVYYIIKTS